MGSRVVSLSSNDALAVNEMLKSESQSRTHSGFKYWLSLFWVHQDGCSGRYFFQGQAFNMRDHPRHAIQPLDGQHGLQPHLQVKI